MILALGDQTRTLEEIPIHPTNMHLSITSLYDEISTICNIWCSSGGIPKSLSNRCIFKLTRPNYRTLDHGTYRSDLLIPNEWRQKFDTKRRWHQINNKWMAPKMDTNSIFVNNAWFLVVLQNGWFWEPFVSVRPYFPVVLFLVKCLIFWFYRTWKLLIFGKTKILKIN